MQRLQLDIRGERLALTESRSSGPAVLLCHSNSTSSQAYAGILRSRLGERYRLVAVDFPGHGDSAASPTPEDTYSIPGLASLLVEVIERLGWQRYALVGHSLGGHALLEALGRLPGAAGLMLISAPAFHPSELGDVYQDDPSGGALFSGVLDDAQVRRFASALLGPGPTAPSLLEPFCSAIRNTDPEFRVRLGHSIGAGAFMNEAAIAASSRVPTALVFGSEDPFIHAAYYAKVKLGNPFKKGAFCIAGAGHCPHLEHGDFMALLQDFLASCLEAEEQEAAALSP